MSPIATAGVAVALVVAAGLADEVPGLFGGEGFAGGLQPERRRKTERVTRIAFFMACGSVYSEKRPFSLDKL